MVVYFDITRGLPALLAMGVNEMHFWQTGGGGRVGYSRPESRRNIVMIDNSKVVPLFRAHLQRINAQWTESPQAPRDVIIHVVEVPTVEEMRSLVAEVERHFKAALRRLVLEVRLEEHSRRRRPRRRRDKR